MDYRASMAERSIGRVLWEWRDATGMSLSESSAKAGFSASKLSMMENAVQPLDTYDVMKLAHVYGVSGKVWKLECRRVEYLARQKKALSESREANLELDATKDFDQVCLEAATLCAFGSDVIPRFVQTPDYSRAVADRGLSPYSADGSTDTAELREIWGRRLSDSGSPISVQIVITDRAVRRIVGDPSVTHATLVCLMQLSELENFRVQVLEHDNYLDARLDSSYSHASFPHRQHNDVVYVESAR